MKILIIGGPRFVGYSLTEALLEKQHTITYFNRGKTNPELFQEQVERITGNRDGEITNIGKKSFDVVIDTCGYVPRVVKQSVDYLKDKTTYYIFISSISVYVDSKEIKRGEDAEVIELEDKTTEVVMGTLNNYGGLKVLCERIVQNSFKEKAIIIRPGYIVGPNDPTNRFTYWPVRIRKGGNVLVPGDNQNKLQFVDVRDLAEFTVNLLENKKTGVYNVAGPSNPYSFKEMSERVKTITGSKANLQFISNKLLVEEKVETIPLWDGSEEYQAMMDVSIERAVKDGLKFRSLEDTVKATLEWYDRIDGDNKKWSAGLDKDTEAKLLQKAKDDA
jgi:2'-hydroxyisoflavone reductase